MKALVWALRGALLIVLVTPLALVGAAPPASLQVLRLLPAPGSTEVPLNGLVTAIFDRPVVPLARLGAGPAAATITPPMAGQQRWLGTTMWAIVPAHGLAPATTYTLRLNPEVRAVDGTTLAAPATPWQFTTLRPAVAGVLPANGATGRLPHTPIELLFNLPVVRASAQAHFSLRLRPGGAALPGAFSWPNARTMRFTPSVPLPRGAFPRIHESTGVLALGGPLPGYRAFSSSFGVAPAFALSSTTPQDGATAVEPYLSVYVQFTAPVDLRAAPRYVSVRPQLAAQYIGVSDQDTLTINGDFRPSTTYRVTVKAGFPDLLGDRLPATRTISFQTAPYQASLQLIDVGSLNTYDAYRPVHLYANVTNVSSVTLNLYRQSKDEFLQTIAPDFNRSTFSPDGLPLVASFTQQVHAPLNKTVAIQVSPGSAQGRLLPPGYYAAFASAPEVNQTQYLPLLVTRSAVTLKYGDNQVLVWANDLQSGAPLAHLPVRVVDANGNVLLRGHTDANGVYTGAVARGMHLAYKTLRALVERPGDAALTGGDWSDGISPYDYNLPFDPTLSHMRLYLNTDRPIYRPGQTVYFRGVIRGDDDGRYIMLPAGERVHVTATDALNHKILDRSLRLNSQGIVNGRLALSDGAALGGYALQATLGNASIAASFSVQAYRKPTFKVLVLPNRGENGQYVQGERIGVTAHADYYFGAPLARAPVQWTVSSTAMPFQPPPAFAEYDFVDQDVLYQLYQAPSNQQISTWGGHTGALGHTALQIPADVRGSPLPHLVTVEANVTSPTQQQVAERSSMIVNPAGVYVGLRPQNYLITPGTRQGIDVATLRPDGTPAPHVTVTLLLQRRTMYSVLQYAPAVGFLWQNHNRDVTLRTFAITTNAAGRAVIHVVLPVAGEFRLAGRARDRLGNVARTATYLYSMAPTEGGYVDWGLANNDRVRLVADRRQYSLGQTAHILVQAPFAGMHALVTLERGTILSHRVLLLRGNSPVIDVPITRADVPNVYVSVVLLKGSGTALGALPVWKMGYVKLVVDAGAHALDVRVTALPLHAARSAAARLPPRRWESGSARRAQWARPGESVRVAIHTADGHGRPVAADVGVALVDAAVLALAANANGTLSDAFYAQRPLGISTATSMALFIDRLNITPGNGHKGGGGAGGGANGPAGVRVKFPDTAYWNPNVLTDAHGNAAFTLTLPDNLTTWHLSADASTTARTLLGSGGADLVATKPVLIEPALPRFLTVRDDSRLGAVVSNLTDRAVRLTVGGTAIIGAGGDVVHIAGRGVVHTPSQNHLALDDPLPAIAVTVPAHGDRAVCWAYVPQVEGPLAVTLDARAATPDLSDALRVVLPVEENSLISPEAAATAGDVSSAAVTETVILPGAIEPGEGDLRLTLEPTLVSGLAGAGTYLLSYPYDGVEQIASRLSGLLALTSLPAYAHGSFGAALPTLAPRLIAQLYTLQGYDGGWGWWPEDPSDPYLSAYAYDTLILARARGFAIDGTVLSNATHYLQGRLTAPPGALDAPNDATRAFILYVLGSAGYPDPGQAAVLYGHRSGLGVGARAELALALSGTFGAHDPRVRTLVLQMSDAARMTSIDAHWDAGPRADWETMQTSESDTAEALRMLIALDPRTPLIPRAVRWLMAQRGIGAPGAGPGPDGAWQSTQATALALRAVARYALRYGDTYPRYRYRIQINGPTVQEGNVTPATAGRPRSVIVPTDALQACALRALPVRSAAACRQRRSRMAGGRGTIHILRSALPDGPPVTATPLHYTVRLRYYPVPGSVGAVDSGISITRRYVTHDGVPLGNHAPAGSTLLVELHLVAPQDLSRVLIEDPLPAGAEAVDGTLLTSSVFAQPGRTPGSPGFSDASPRPGQPQDLSPYVDHVELRDDRTALFASAIPAGRYVYRYALHLTTPGHYHVLPAHAAQLYEPEVFGHTSEASFAVR